MKRADWIKTLETEVEKRFDKTQVNGFEDSAPSIKLGILSEMYEAEGDTLPLSKELAYEELAEKYEGLSAWN